MYMIMNEEKRKKEKKGRKRHINTYGNKLLTYSRNSFVLYCYSTIILLKMDFKTSVPHTAAICTNIVKLLSTASEGNENKHRKMKVVDNVVF
jgi:hypothetical protein